MSFENITMLREACRLLAHNKQYTHRLSWLWRNICTRTFNVQHDEQSKNNFIHGGDLNSV